MQQDPSIWKTPRDYLRAHRSAHPVLFFSPQVLQATARRYLQGFPGEVTYAVKANPERMVLENLVAAGIQAFDVASIDEVERVQEVLPKAVLHFNNPVRTSEEVTRAVALGVRSFAVDSFSELRKLAGVAPEGSEVSVRFRTEAEGAAYDFGGKFGVDVAEGAELMQVADALGFRAALTFHPGTQCTAPEAWVRYIETAAEIASLAGLAPHRLNVGGGFPARRSAGDRPDLCTVFEAICSAATQAFGPELPLLCEPGRGLVAECITLGVRVRAVRDENDVFLNDGIYGGFAEAPLIGGIDRLDVRDPDGHLRQGDLRSRVLFGPTCDSIDRLPGEFALPADIAEGDCILFRGMGAYSTVTATRFNGFGRWEVATVQALSG